MHPELTQSGFSCNSLTVAIARKVTLVPRRCGVRDVSAIPTNSSSAQRFSIA
jgi:hypothetical protein